MSKRCLLFWFLGYKVVWLICVLGGGVYGYPFFASLPMLLWVVLWVLNSEKRRAVFVLTCFSLFYGTCWDSIFTISGVMIFSPTAQTGTPLPLWMMMLWLGFGAIFRQCFASFHSKKYALCAIGAIGGPMAYLGGAKMEAMTIGVSKNLFVVAIGLEWAIALPLFMWLLGILEEKAIQE